MNDQDIADYINIAAEELRRLSVELDGWPDVLALPEPRNEAEREGLRLFRQEMEAAGIKVELRLCTG